jgi:hypothetical protein
MLLSNGNRKIGNDTLIFNMTPATNCPSKKLGLCKLPEKCYAMKAERCYPQVLPYRKRQEWAWKDLTIKEFYSYVSDFIKPGIKYFRFSESGDFRTQEDVDKMSELAELLKKDKVRVYGYTARSDLNYRNISNNIIVNGSGFMVSNSFTATLKPKGIVCGGNCRVCKKCKSARGLKIQVKIH